MDDTQIFGDRELVLEVQSILKNLFKLTELDSGEWFLGIRIQENEDFITMAQTRYIQKLIQKIRVENAKPSSAHLSISEQLYEVRS